VAPAHGHGSAPPSFHFSKLDETEPSLKIKLLGNMLRVTARIATRLTSDVGLGEG